MRKGGEITGFAQVVKPYVLRHGPATALNASSDVSESLQNLILQHCNISTFLRHYLDRNITADDLSIYRGLTPQKAIMDMLCSMSRSIDPRRLWKLTTEESKSVNDQPRVRVLKANVDTLKIYVMGLPLETSQRELLNEKQRARAQLKRVKLDQYKQEQPVIDSERQLSGGIINEDVKNALEGIKYMTPEHLTLIDAILTLPGRTWEAEQQRRINAMNAVTKYCGVEEGSWFFRQHNLQGPTTSASVQIGRQLSQPQPRIHEAIQIVMADKRPTICFLCLQNPALPESQRVSQFKRPGELTRHFERKHLNKFQGLNCILCQVTLQTLSQLMLHAETKHGTVTRNSKYRILCNSPHPSAVYKGQLSQ
ncbi:hypothetical protein PAAG_12606 [Paracoccidioides lutzii Pb01]|uniref:C2H2-type domain-containing protein n=1 Tax=Paracoccidioides lutzii (strain ATCC MYA-826 / Pb01) TaxID=502779 RepID=A0A0A2UZS2_PARBA|nr:hypothetical protein PAAG_12606 [Paracoccidioides lutzii Pb01]KGQ00728.1 hypothetical protein PAAG_12606 [Paracoccidioides lutzii Pb01]